LADAEHQSWLEEHAGLICDELNVKAVEFADKSEQYITYTILPDLKRLGPRLGKRLPALKKYLAQSDGGKLLAQLQSQGKVTLNLPDGPVMLDAEDIQVRLQAKEGWAAAQGKTCVVVLATKLTDELIEKGLAREEVRVIQDIRKEQKLNYTDRIIVAIKTQSTVLSSTNATYEPYIRGETLAEELIIQGELPNVQTYQVQIGGHTAQLQVQKKDISTDSQ
jgi:isoleucyl-tRNA synthetase